MVRATNTGATAIINTDGKLIKQLPLFKEGTLHGYVQGYKGETPYITVSYTHLRAHET